MAVQQVSSTPQSQALWAELRRLVGQIDGGNGAGLGNDQLILTSGDPNALFNLPPKGTLGPSDSGSEVAKVQQILRQLGYYKEATNTGVYGLMTVIAVKAFQQEYGIPVLGEVGVNTRQAMADALAGRRRPKPPTAPVTSGGWTPPTTSGGWTSPVAGSPTYNPPAPPASTPVSTSVPGWNGLPNPNSYFISQLYDPRFNPYAPRVTANCGPTSLAMILKAFGKAPSYSNVENLIDQVRYRMTGRNDNNEYTNENQLISAGSAYGLSSTRVNNVDQIESQLKQGKLVVLAGNPAAYNYAFSSDQYFPFSGPHFIVVSQVDGDRVVINDPLSHVGAIVINRKHLQEFMSYKGWYSGVAFSPM